MTKAERTRAHIIEQAAGVFNQYGYAGTSLSDIMEMTGLTKGGIYGNFRNKEELAEAAFDYNVQLLFESAKDTVQSQKNSIEKLLDLLDIHKDNLMRYEFRCGCPILNTSTEVDDAFPELKEKLKNVLDHWYNLLVKIIDEGIKKAEIKPDINAAYYAGLFISMVEGGVWMAKVYDEPGYLNNNLHEIKKILLRDLKLDE